MPKVVVRNFCISLDGFGAGPDQSLNDPVGVGGHRLHEWIFETRFGQQMIGGTAGSVGLDNDFLERGDENVGATIMGRNMFSPVRGAWPDESWRGWWGHDPPYHHPVFVLTHHPRPAIEMLGGPTFYFVADGIRAALDQALDAAGGRDVRIGGGVSAIQQYLQAGLVDELHLAIVPTLLGSGERLFESSRVGSPALERAEVACSPAVAHMVLRRAT